MTSQLVDDEMGKMAYDAFMTQTGVVDPPWDGLNRHAQEAWIASARTIAWHVESQIRTELYEEHRR